MNNKRRGRAGQILKNTNKNLTKNTRYDIVNTHKEKRQENSRNKQNNRYLTKYQIGCIMKTSKMAK